MTEQEVLKRFLIRHRKFRTALRHANMTESEFISTSRATSLSHMFAWCHTPEGEDYWRALDFKHRTLLDKLKQDGITLQ